MKSSRKTNSLKIWNMLLVLVIIVILLLGYLLYRMMQKKEHTLDLSNEYSITLQNEKIAATEFSLKKANPFSANLCVTGETVAIEGVRLTTTMEKGLLINMDTNEAVFAQGIYDKVFPASLTKLMTAILALDYGHMDQVVTMIDADFDMEEGAQVSGMTPGMQVTMDQLFHALVVYSANDAAMAIARTVGGSVDHFVFLMNEKAKELGMTGTNFMNPHGLHDSNHYTTAYDIYLLLNAAYQYETYRECMHMSMYTLKIKDAEGNLISTIRLDATDEYLTGEKKAPANVFIQGGKTGTTSQAGACLAIVSLNAYGVPYLSVIMNADNRPILYNDMNALLSQINN